MDLFNTKKIAVLEARLAALEPKSSEEAATIAELATRIKEIEQEVMPRRRPFSLFDIFNDMDSEKLTLRRKVDRLCDHLKVQFVTEPQRTFIKPIKAQKK